MQTLLLFLFLFKSYEYNPSLYAPKTDDFILALEADSFYFIENIPTPPKAKPISEAKFTTQVIDEESYGWPGHVRTIDATIEDEEGKNMYDFYKNRVNLTQEEMYYHPKAPEQTWSTWDAVNKLQRTKVKVTLDPYHRSFRTTNLYMPPGELITFEVFPDAINLVKVILEPHRQHVSINDRLKYLQCETRLTQPKTTWGYPTGGAVSFELFDTSKNVPIEINVSGCALAPHFIYGVTDEKEWEESIRTREAPSAMITNGAINAFMPANTIRDVDRMDDVQAWWRSAALRSQEIAPDPMGVNDKYHFRHPLNWRYDNFVGCGIACAYSGANFVDFTPDWANSANKIDILKNGNPWGTIHEMNHHHQDGWAFKDMDPALTEGTNNVLNTWTYTYQNSASGSRTVDSNLNPICLVDHLETIHPYCLVDWGFIECEWDIIFHCLGRDVFKKYMDLNMKNEPYSWQLYNGYGKHVLTLMEATGYDVYEYCNWFCEHTDRKTMYELLNYNNKYQNFMEAYKSHPAYGKYFHFMGCFYACGFIRNNQRFETARPYKINPYLNTTFDFNKALKQRSGNKTLWGDFVFDRIESKRQDAWTEISKGVFTYKPFDSDISFIDEALAIYIDLTTGEEYINIVRLELRPINKVHTVYYYNFTEDVCNRDKSVEECYKNINKHTLYKEILTDYKGIPSIPERNLTAVTDISFTPTVTDDFYLRADIHERGFVYVSENPITGDYDEIEQYKVLTKNWYHDINAGNVNGGLSAPIHFEKGKKYYIRLVANNADKPSICIDQPLCKLETKATVFLKETRHNNYMDNSNMIKDEWFEFQKPLDYRPDLIDFKYNDAYEGEKLIKNLPTHWTANVSLKIKKVYTLTNTDFDYSQGLCCNDCDDTNVSETLTNWDPSTEVRSGWWPVDTEGQPFPHIWDVNFNGEETFDSVYLKGAYNQYHFPMLSNISIYLNSLESSSIGIENDDNLIFNGIYDSKINKPIELNQQYKGKYLRIVVHDNRINWKDGHPGRSTFAYISVGRYLCVSNYKVPRGCNWEVRKDGYYLNGRAFVGKAGDKYSYVPDEGINQVAIVGDRFVGMGVAKVFLDNVLVKTIDENDIDQVDWSNLKYTSRSFRRILYASPFFNNQPEIRIEVESGEFRLTGFLVGSTNKSFLINNGPMPTQTPTAYPDITPIPPRSPTPKPDESDSNQPVVPPEVPSSQEVVVPPEESSSQEVIVPPEESSSQEVVVPPEESSSQGAVIPPEVPSSQEVIVPPEESSSQEVIVPPEESSSQEVVVPPEESSSQEVIVPPEESSSQEVIVPPEESSSQEVIVPPEESSSQEAIAPPEESSSQGAVIPPEESSSKEVIVPPEVPISPEITKQPTPPTSTGPTIDKTSEASSDKIEFTENGFKDGEENHDTTQIRSDVVLIQGHSNKITLIADATKEPKQDKYLSVQQPNTEITIELPESGDYGKGEFGIHPNSKDPKINIPTSSVPLNIFNDRDNSVLLETVGSASSSESITIQKVTSTNGRLSLKLPSKAKSFEAKEINLYNEALIESFAGSTPIDTIIGQLNLKDGSKSKMTNINIKNGLTADSNSKLNIEGKAVFNSSSSIILTDSSFIEFGKSIIDGICNSIALVSSTKASLLADESKSTTLICGELFECDRWLSKFTGNDEFPKSRCDNIEKEKCLVAFSEKKNDNDGGKGKGKSNIGIIIGVVVAVVVVIAIVVGVVIYLNKKKKSNHHTSSFENFGNDLNETNFDYNDI
ncbi:hypothetical protein M9Y10_045730 [Tritrichomonas musculus]|uniref:Peptidase M60 domain-containing protein n=1 Tax=Tritrichomonas musculus TaxID=1915356 RepID=A0ABR2JXU7_9EUKA